MGLGNASGMFAKTPTPGTLAHILGGEGARAALGHPGSRPIDDTLSEGSGFAAELYPLDFAAELFPLDFAACAARLAAPATLS
jgi:hypothetical protein